MTVTKVVGFDLRIPKHFSLHFYDFSTILYEFSKFTALEKKKEKGSLFAQRPLNFKLLFLLTRGPWRTLENRGGISAWFPARFGPGGEGKVGEKSEGARAHLPVVSVGAEVACGGLSAGTSGRRRLCTAAAALRRGGGGLAGLGGFFGAR